MVLSFAFLADMWEPTRWVVADSILVEISTRVFWSGLPSGLRLSGCGSPGGLSPGPGSRLFLIGVSFVIQVCIIMVGVNSFDLLTTCVEDVFNHMSPGEYLVLGVTLGVCSMGLFSSTFSQPNFSVILGPAHSTILLPSLSNMLKVVN